MNRCFFTGMIIGNTRLETTRNDNPVLKGTLSLRKRGRDGEDEYQRLFWEMYGNRAEALENLLVKGAMVAMLCEYRFSEWENADGEQKSRTSFVVWDVDILKYAEDYPEEEEEVDEEDIPF
jgi:single-stranded DNA-binding protein